MPLVWDDDVVQIDLAEGEWVKVKRQFSHYDQIRIQQAIGRDVRLDSSYRPVVGADIPFGPAYEAAEFAALEIAIKEWSFRHHGEPVPVDAENIRRLSRDDMDTV